MSPARTSRPGTRQQPLQIPGYDNENGLNVEDPKHKKDKRDSKDGEYKKGHSRSSAKETSHNLDIAKILKQQAEILQLMKKIPNVAGQTSAHAPSSSSVPAVSHSMTSAERGNQVQINQAQSNQATSSATAALQGDEEVQVRAEPNQGGENIEQGAEQDTGLVSALNLAFTIDPNAGSDIDGDIAQFIENCLTLPNALEWEDMKVIREIYKRPKNCPHIGVPKIPDSLGLTMSQAGKDRDKHMGYAQAWVMTALSAMGNIASELKTFEMDTTVPWVRPLYAKSLDVIRVLSHLSVNEISKRRKAEVKAFLPVQYKKLANPRTVEPVIKLFGEEIAEEVRVCDEEAKITNKLRSADFVRGRYHPYRSQRGRPRFTGPAIANRQYQGNWQTQYQQQSVQYPQQQQQTHYQGFQQATTPPAPPTYQFQPRPYRGRPRGQRRRGAKL